MKQVKDFKKVEINNNVMSQDNMTSIEDSNARMNLFISFETFHIEIRKEQYDIIIKILNDISNYQQFQYNYFLTRKFNYFRPKTNENNKYKLLWKFAVKMVIKQIKFHKGNSNVFQIPKEIMVKYEEIFTDLFPKYYTNEKKLNEDELKVFKKIVECVDMKDLFLWSKPVLQGIFTEQRKQDIAIDNKKKIGFFSSFMRGNDDKKIFEISQEEMQQIESLLERVVNEDICILGNDEKETKYKVDFVLAEGSFKFSKSHKVANGIITEGFSFNYKQLVFNIRRGEMFTYVDSELKDFDISMFSIVANNITTIPITYKTLSLSLNQKENSNAQRGEASLSQRPKQKESFWKFSIYKNHPNDPINLMVFIQINSLNFIYNQVFFERIISFFTVKVDEQLANLAMGKFMDFKESTQQTIKENIHKKNIVNFVIRQREILIPINKYDIKNSKMLYVNLGKISITTSLKSTISKEYKDTYTLALSPSKISYYSSLEDILNSHNKGFDIINNLGCKIEVGFLDKSESIVLPSIQAIVEINNINIGLNQYLFPLLMFLSDILKPTKNVDVWSQLNTDKEEIKANAKNVIKVNKKNNIYFTWDEYSCVLSSGYLYFYKFIEDEEYEGYFYLRDSVIIHNKQNELIVIIENKYGNIELMFNNKEEMLKWEFIVKERVTEMKLAYDLIDESKIIESEGESEEKVVKNNNDIDKNKCNDIDEIIFSANIKFKNISGLIYVESDKSIALEFPFLQLSANMRKYDYNISLLIEDAYLKDPNNTNAEFEEIIVSNKNIAENDRVPFLKIEILIADEHSPKYNNIQINVSLQFGFIKMNWNPDIVKAVLGVVVHNDIIKAQIAQEISNKNTQKQNFINYSHEGMMKKKCSDYTYSYIKVSATFKKIQLVWVNPILNIKFTFVDLNTTTLLADLKEDHYTIEGSLGDLKIFDLSNYPYNTQNDTKTKIFGIKNDINAPLLKFKYMSMYSWCPSCKDNFLSKADVQINSVFLVYLHEHSLRVLDFLLNSFLGAISSSDEVKIFLLEQYNEKPKNEKDIDFMELNIKINNPELLLKPRFKYNNYFIVNAETVIITCSYEKVYGKVRNDKEEYRYLSKYQFNMDKFTIRTKDDFCIVAPTKAIVNMNTCEYTETDKIIYTDLEFDYSYQFDILFNEVDFNLRQKDFTLIKRLLDLNLLYRDSLSEQYDYRKVNRKKKKEKNKSTLLNNIQKYKYTKEERNVLMSKYDDIIAYIIFNKIHLTLHLIDDTKTFPFAKLNFKNFHINIIQKLNTNDIIHVYILQFEGYHIYEKDPNRKELIFSELSNDYINTPHLGCIENYITNRTLLKREFIEINSPQFELRAFINAQSEKDITAKVNGFKMIFRYDTINLLKEFFVEGFPYYDKDQIDLPLNYDPDDENDPSLSFSLKIENPLICLMTDSLKNKAQELICLTSSFFIEIKFEKISSIKKMLYDKYIISKDKEQDNSNKEVGYIFYLKVAFSDICPFFSTLNEFTQNANQILHKSKTGLLRKFMDNCSFEYKNKIQVQFVPLNNYEMTSIDKLNLNKVTLKTSYRDIVLLYKMFMYNKKTMSSRLATHLDNLCTYTKTKKIFEQKEKIINKGLANKTLKSQRIQVILIDDHTNTLYPFLSFSIIDLTAISKSLDKYLKVINVQMLFKVLNYNYFAGEWEPMVEKTKIAIEITNDKSKVSNINNMIHIKTLPMKNKPNININLSDMSISFLIKTLGDWMEKLKQSIKNIGEADSNLKITNHTIFNYSGRKINVYRKIKEKFVHVERIGENESYEIEYFANKPESETRLKAINNDNIILFDLHSEKDEIPLVVKNNVLNIDNLGYRVHPISTISLKENFVCSKISFANLKKHIYFYSPICFKNKTSFTITLILIMQKKSNSIIIKPNETFGVPHELISSGTFQLSLNNIQSSIYRFSSLLTDNQLLEEFNFNGTFINIYHPKGVEEKNKIILIRVSYSIRNCLPFEIQLILNEQNEMYIIKTNETAIISCLSVKKNLKCYIFFYNFHTSKEIVLYNIKTQYKMDFPVALEDNEGNQINIYVSVVNSYHKEIVIHANSVLINHTGLDMKIFYARNDEKRIPIANQDKGYNVFILNDEKYIQFATKNNEYISKKTPFNVIGTTSVIQLLNVNNPNIKKYFIMEVNLSLLSHDFDIYTTIVYLVPRIIIYNQLDFTMRVYIGNQMGEKVESNKKIPFYYYGDTFIRFIPIGVNDHSEWELSSPISLVSGAFATLKCHDKDNKQRVLYFNLNKKIDSLSTYLILSKPNFQTNQITIENNSKIVEVKVYQFEYDKYFTYLSCSSKSFFTWNNQYKNNKICFVLYSEDKYSSEEKTYEIRDDKVVIDYQQFEYPYKEIIKISYGQYNGREIKLTIKNEGMRYRIKLNDYTKMHNLQKSNVSLKEYEINVIIEKLGLSLIADNRNLFLDENNKNVQKYKRNEICYFTFEEIVFYDRIIVKTEPISNSLNSKETSNEMQLIITKLQIDNEISYVKQFPVILIPITHRKRKSLNKSSTYTNSYGNISYSANTQSNFALSLSSLSNSNNSLEQKPQPFFNCAILFNKNSNDSDFTKIKFFNYLIQEFILNLESSVIVGIYNFFNNINTDLKTSFMKINPIFLKEEDLIKKKDIIVKDSFFVPSWLNKTDFFSHKQNLFISELRVSSLGIELTFINQTKDNVFQKILHNNRIFISTMLSTISNIEKVNLNLNGCELSNFSGDWNGLISNILYVYQQKMLLTLLKLIGSIDIIGDPLNLMTSLGKGFKDLFTKPAMGIMKGPLQGAIGLMDGTFSLAKHTIEGTLGSTSKLTSGISKSFLMLTLDNNYINRRESKKITQRPNDAIEGIGYGLSSMAGGLFYGITDLVKKPFEGAKKEKIKGFGKGILKGLGGVVLKPISGVFDLVSKTTEGIKNNVRKEDSFEAKRIPRVFYGKYKYIKSYKLIHALVFQLLLKIDDIKGNEFDFYTCEKYKNTKDDNILLAFLTNGIYVIDIICAELKSIIEYKNIKDVTVDAHGKIKIIFNKLDQGRSYTSINIKDHSNDPIKIMKLIKETLENTSENI